MSAIARHFVRLGARTAHCRIAGSGPAIILLHQSPQNSRMWLQLIERLAPRYTVIAPDTPGFGDSDPLSNPQPEIADLASATLELADALGLERFAVFGMHTGGLIGMHLAWSAPARVAALIVDGFAAFDADERAAMDARYLPRFTPSWDGTHLRWLWCRMREQLFYFPWYDGRAAAALRLEPPTPQATHAAAMDILEVGDVYRQGYAAALRYAQRHRVAELQVPTWLLYRVEDVLATHRERLPLLPAHVSSELISGGLPALHARIDAVLEQTLAGEATARPQLALPTDDGFRRRAVPTTIGTLAIWHAPGHDSVVLRLHAPGRKPPRPDPAAPRERAHLLLLDLPGHGGSDPIASAHDAQAVAVAIAQALEQLVPGLPWHIEADGASAAYALALAERRSARDCSLHLHTPWLLTAREIDCLLAGLPDPAIARSGAHLLDAFQWERDRHLLWPWLPPTAAARRLVDAPDPHLVHDNTVELLRLGPRLRSLLTGALDHTLAQRILDARVAVRVSANPADDHEGRVAALAARAPQPLRNSA